MRLVIRIMRAAVFLTVLLLSSAANAYDLKLCAKSYMAYTDNGYGEAYYANDNYRDATGALIRVRRAIGCDFSGASGYTTYVNWTPADFQGCSPEFVTSYVDACYELAITSTGTVAANNDVNGYNGSGQTEWWYITGVDPPNQSGSSSWLFPGLDSFRMYLTAAFAVESNARGILTNTTLKSFRSTTQRFAGAAPVQMSEVDGAAPPHPPETSAWTMTMVTSIGSFSLPMR